jgi:hypothetical protein
MSLSQIPVSTVVRCNAMAPAFRSLCLATESECLLWSSVSYIALLRPVIKLMTKSTNATTSSK